MQTITSILEHFIPPHVHYYEMNRISWYNFLNKARLLILSYSGKLSREKTFADFAVLWPFAKVLSAKFGGVASFGAAKASNP